MTKIKFHNYGRYSSDNYGAHSLCFTDAKGRDFYFSYNTLVAFSACPFGLVCLKNYWGNTTGKHLNWIQPDKERRVDQETFDKMLKQTRKLT
jgi:hypothetical protein